ncbi:MAG: hypothetical protein GKR94_03420 [Gammaproteobacteria bacterium]|nr:hypothetical protein [Gammaproteobacteria bacterium]
MFFFAFAATVEIILGAWRYILVFLALAIGTHVTYSPTGDTVPTLSLYGVVMGVMGLYAWFLPTSGIRLLSDAPCSAAARPDTPSQPAAPTGPPPTDSRSRLRWNRPPQARRAA